MSIRLFKVIFIIYFANCTLLKIESMNKNQDFENEESIKHDEILRKGEDNKKLERDQIFEGSNKEVTDNLKDQESKKDIIVNENNDVLNIDVKNGFSLNFTPFFGDKSSSYGIPCIQIFTGNNDCLVKSNSQSKDKYSLQSKDNLEKTVSELKEKVLEIEDMIKKVIVNDNNNTSMNDNNNTSMNDNNNTLMNDKNNISMNDNNNASMNNKNNASINDSNASINDSKQSINDSKQSINDSNNASMNDNNNASMNDSNNASMNDNNNTSMNDSKQSINDNNNASINDSNASMNDNNNASMNDNNNVSINDSNNASINNNIRDNSSFEYEASSCTSEASVQTFEGILSHDWLTSHVKILTNKNPDLKLEILEKLLMSSAVLHEIGESFKFINIYICKREGQLIRADSSVLEKYLDLMHATKTRHVPEYMKPLLKRNLELISYFPVVKNKKLIFRVNEIEYFLMTENKEFLRALYKFTKNHFSQDARKGLMKKSLFISEKEKVSPLAYIWGRVIGDLLYN